MATYNSIYRSPGMAPRLPTTLGYGNPIPVTGQVPMNALTGSGQPAKYGTGFSNNNLNYQQPSYGSYGGGINDATLAPGASYSGGGGGGSLPPGAVPVDPFGGGNADIMARKGYRKQLINGQWAWLPPAPVGTPPQYNNYVQ